MSADKRRYRRKIKSNKKPDPDAPLSLGLIFLRGTFFSSIKSFCGGRPGGSFFKKSPLEIAKGTKRVRSVGWAGLKANEILFFLPIRCPKRSGPDCIRRMPPRSGL